MARKGSMSIGIWESTKGESHRCAKMTDAKVREILIANDRSRDQEFAERFKVSRVLVQKIRTRQRWRHVSIDG